jgi:hypothetical protein
MNREYLETARLLIQVAPLVFVDDPDHRRLNQGAIRTLERVGPNTRLCLYGRYLSGDGRYMADKG